MTAVYASIIITEMASFFRWLAPIPDDQKRLVLEGNWNAILDPKIYKVAWGAWRAGRCESNLIDLITRHALVDRFRLDHPGREMWTWLDSSPSTKIGSYLDRVLEELTLISLVVSHSTRQGRLTINLLGSVSGQLIGLIQPATRSSIPSYWRYGTSGSG